MASRWDALKTEYEYLDAQDTQVRFLSDRTGFSADAVTRVLVHVNTPATYGEEWDLVAQAENAGMGVEEYGLAMSPLLQMSLEQAQARLHEVQAQLARGENPTPTVDELEKVRKFEAIVGKITSVSGQGPDVVVAILFAFSVLKNRQREIIQELARLKALGEGPD